MPESRKRKPGAGHSRKRPLRKDSSTKINKKIDTGGAKQWVLAVICSIMIVCAIAFAASRIGLANMGKDTTQELAETFLEAVEKQNKSKLKECLLNTDPNYDKITESLMSYINTETAVSSIDYDDIIFEELNPNAIETLEEEMGVSGIEDTAFTYMEVPITRKLDGNTYNTCTLYYMTSYKALGKWYLYDIMKEVTYVLSGAGPNGEQIDVAGAYRLFNTMMIGGDADMGFIPLDNTWYTMEDPESEQTEPLEGAVKDLAYIQESGNAVIHMVLLESDLTAHELADILYENLNATKTDDMELTINESAIQDRKAWNVALYSQEQDLFFFAWLIDTKDYDGKIRYLTLESTTDYTGASLYITNYLTPDEHTATFQTLIENLYNQDTGVEPAEE